MNIPDPEYLRKHKPGYEADASDSRPSGEWRVARYMRALESIVRHDYPEPLHSRALAEIAKEFVCEHGFVRCEGCVECAAWADGWHHDHEIRLDGGEREQPPSGQRALAAAGGGLPGSAGAALVVSYRTVEHMRERWDLAHRAIREAGGEVERKYLEALRALEARSRRENRDAATDEPVCDQCGGLGVFDDGEECDCL